MAGLPCEHLGTLRTVALRGLRGISWTKEYRGGIDSVDCTGYSTTGLGDLVGYNTLDIEHAGISYAGYP